MIGSRVTAAVVAVAAAAAFGGGGPRPEVADGARRAVADAADQALAATTDLRDRLVPALDAARVGAGRVVAGSDGSPGEPLIASAEAVESSLPAATRLATALGRLQRARLALAPGAADLPPAPRGDELASIGTQLRGTADAGEAFAAMRRRAEGVTTVLLTSVRDAAAGDLAAARAGLATARADVEALEAWGVGAVTLSVWLETVNAMIGAVERTLDATERGDPDAVEAAARAVAALGEDASSADRALRIAIGEAGSAVTATALGRLDAALRSLDVLALEIASVRDGEAG